MHDKGRGMCATELPLVLPLVFYAATASRQQHPE